MLNFFHTDALKALPSFSIKQIWVCYHRVNSSEFLIVVLLIEAFQNVVQLQVQWA